MKLFYSMLNSYNPCGSLFGIPVTVHSSCFILLGYFLWAALDGADAQGVAAVPVAVYLMIMGINLFHELGHAGVARLFGYPTQMITLTGIGGVASINLPTDQAASAARLAIYCGGPAVHLILLVGGLLMLGCPDLGVLPEISACGLPGWEAFYAIFVCCNVVIFALNMLPVVPLDGGQILRNLTALVIGQPTARIVALMSTAITGSTFVQLAAEFNIWAGAVLLTVMARVGVRILYGEKSDAEASKHESSI